MKLSAKVIEEVARRKALSDGHTNWEAVPNETQKAYADDVSETFTFALEAMKAEGNARPGTLADTGLDQGQSANAGADASREFPQVPGTDAPTMEAQL